MSAAPEAGRSGACADCLRRSWLLAELSPLLDYRARDGGRLIELLALEDRELLLALAGRRAAELKDRHARFDPARLARVEGVETLCRHDARYPRALSGAGTPRMLHVAGGADRLQRLTAAPVVAIVGSTRATDYGVQMARTLARGLAASGVSVAGGLGDGIAAAAQVGALEIDAGAIVAMSGGVDVAAPAKRRLLQERVRHNGCLVAGLPVRRLSAALGRRRERADTRRACGVDGRGGGR